MPSNPTYTHYSQVPWFRKNWFNSLLVALGLFIPLVPLIPIVILLTGDIYQDNYDDKGNLKSWSWSQKLGAWFLLVMQVLTFALLYWASIQLTRVAPDLTRALNLESSQEVMESYVESYKAIEGQLD